MAKITDIKPQAHNRGRVSIYADGEFLCGLEKITALEHRLKIGDEVEPDELADLVASSERTAAFEKAANYLGLRPRTLKEIRSYLSSKGYAPDTVEYAADKLCEYGYVNDAAYAKQYVAEYRRKYGSIRMSAELREKGVPREFIDIALEELDQTDDAAAIAEKYLASHAPDRRKLTAYLLSKGFDYDTVRAGLEKLEDLADDDD